MVTYKKYIRKFNEGTPQEWIEFMENLDEVWNQNLVTQPKDKVAVICTILEGKTCATFNSTFKETMKNDQGEKLENQNDGPIAKHNDHMHKL